MNQADGYIQDFIESGSIDGTPMIRAFVVGHEIAPKTVKDKELKEDQVVRGRIQATTYSQLTRAAYKRLFNLKDRIPARYEDISGAALSEKIMGTPSQAEININQSLDVTLPENDGVLTA